MAAVGQATLGALSQAAMELERSRLITLLHGVHVARQVDCRSEIDSQASCMWPAQYPSGCEVCRGRDAHWTALLRDGAMRRTNRHDRDTNTDSGCPTVPPASPRVRTRFGTSASRLGICWHRSESELAFADRGVKKSDPATEAKGPKAEAGSRPNRTRLSIRAASNGGRSKMVHPKWKPVGDSPASLPTHSPSLTPLPQSLPRSILLSQLLPSCNVQPGIVEIHLVSRGTSAMVKTKCKQSMYAGQCSVKHKDRPHWERVHRAFGLHVLAQSYARSAWMARRWLL